MKNIQYEIDTLALEFIEMYGRAPTHIAMSVDRLYEVQSQCNPYDGYYVPASYSINIDFDRVRGLIITLAHNCSDKKYMKVLGC